MKRIGTDQGDFWIGKHLNLGLVVFDPKFQQSTNELWVRLFVIAEGRWGLFTREKARTEVTEPISESEFQQVNDAWFATRGRLLPLLNREAHCHGCTAPLRAWSAPICLKCNWMKCPCGSCGYNRPKEEQKIEQIVARHKKMIETAGIDYLGTRLGAQVDPGKRRITHCWRCHDNIDNVIDLECVACNWILCNCGACGCSRSKAANT